MTTVCCGMAEDREDGSPGDEVEQFEVLDEVGEVEGWDSEFPDNDDDDDEQDMEDKDEQVESSPYKNVKSEPSVSKEGQSNKATASEDVMMKEAGTSKEAPSKESSASKDVNSKESSTRTDAKSKESSTSQDVKSEESSTSTDAQSKESSTSKDAKCKDSSTSKDEKSKESSSKDAKSKESSTNTDAQSKESSTSKDVKSKDFSTNKDEKSKESSSKDTKSKESSTSTDAKSKESSTSTDAKSKESSSKDVKSKESSASKDATSKESSASKDEPSKESSASKDAKSKESSSSKDAKSKESSTSKDAKSIESSTSKDAKSKESSSKEALSKESSASKDAPSKESSASKDENSRESCTSKDAPSKESSASKDARSKESATSKDAKSTESSVSKDVKSKESSINKDAKSKESSTRTDAKSKESSTRTDAKSKESSTSKDEKSKESSTNKDTTSGKDGKSSNQPSSGKDTNHTHKDVLSISSGIQKDNKTSEDKKTETKGSVSQQKSTDSVVKRKSNNPGAQKPEAKRMKIYYEKGDNKRQPSVEKIEVISTDLWKEHQLRKKRFAMSMIYLSEDLKREKEYRRWVENERKDGMLFPMFDIDQPAEPILLSCCQLVSGYENDSTTLCLGLARNDEVLRFSACEAKYVPQVRSTVKAFEEMIRSYSKPLFDPITWQGYWRSVTVIANSRNETLLKVDLYAANEQEGLVRLAEAREMLVKYISRAVLDCHIRSIYVRLVFDMNYGTENAASERTTARCLIGNNYIIETISGLKVHLYPWSYFSTGTSAMTALCEAMLKVVLQERCETVVELGCGTGIVGQFLARHCGIVLGVDTFGCIAEARINAKENNLSNCTYYNKNMEGIWTKLGDLLRGKPSVMVIVNALNYDFLDEGPVITWLSRSNQICRVVYVKMLKAPKSKVVSLCTPRREPKKHHDDPMSYFPLYALPVNLGDKFFATVLVLQHVESNFIDELYETREKYTVKCIRIANLTSGLQMVEDDPWEERKHRSTSSAAEKNVSVSKHNDKNASGNINDGKNVARDRRLSDSRGPTRKGVDTSRTIDNRWDELPRGDRSNHTNADHSAGSRNVWVNKDGTLTTHIVSRHDGTLSPQDLRNVLQSRPGHNHTPGFLDKHTSPGEIQDLRTVLQGKRMYAERHMSIADDCREERFVDEIIHDGNRNLLDSSFVHSVVPPRTEDLRQVLQEKKVMAENIARDRNERSREFNGRGQARVHENNDLRSLIEENRATHKNERKDSFRESSRLPHNAETLGGAHMRMSFRDELTSGRDLYPPDVREKLHSRNNEPEAFPLVKDSAMFERGLDSKINIRDERRKVMLADIQVMRSIDADLHGPGPGRSFDDTELGRRKPRTDDIASGIKTDVRGINIRAGGWKARDEIRKMESIHDSFSKFDAYLSNVQSSMKDFQHSGKAKPEFNQYFPNDGRNSEQCALSSNSKPEVTGDIQRENPYSNDKPNYFGEGGQSSKSEWLAFDERRAEDGIAKKNQVTFGSEDNRIKFNETDRNRTHIDGSERNRVVGEAISERKNFVGPGRTGASFGSDDRNRNMLVRAEDRKRQVSEIEDRNKQVFSEPNRNKLIFGGSEDRKRPLYDHIEDRNRLMYGELGDRKRQMYDEPDNRKRQFHGETDDKRRQMYGELVDAKRQVHDEPVDRKRLMYDEPGDRKRSMYVEPEDLKRLPYEEPRDLKRSRYDEPGVLKRSTYDEPENMKRSAYDEPGDRKRSLYDQPGDRKRSTYDEPGDRKRSVYDGSKDGSGYMFGKTDDRNFPVTERSRPVVNEVGWNRPTVEEIERNRLMTGEREREKVLFGGRTDINRTGYYAADSKVASYNRDYEEDRHSFINDASAGTNLNLKDTCSKISQSRGDISPKIQHVQARQLPPRVEDVDKEASKRHHHRHHHHHHQQQQHTLLPPTPPPPLLSDEQMVEVQNSKEKRRHCSVASKKAQKMKIVLERSSVAKGKDGKNLYVGDRFLEKGPQAYRAVDRSRELAASHQTPSSSNREWDKVQSNVGHSSTALWSSSWGQEGKQREAQERHGTFRSLQLVDTTKPPPSFGQHVGKYGTSDEPGRSTLPSLSTFGQSPQNYGHSYQQYGMSGSAPAQPLAVGTGDMSQYSSWQGGGPGGRNTLSGRGTTSGWGTPGAWNTSNNWSSQSGNASNTWR